MPLRGPAELESTLRTRLHNSFQGLVTKSSGEQVSIVNLTTMGIIKQLVFSELLNMVTSGLISGHLISGDRVEWCTELSAKIQVAPGPDGWELDVGPISQKVFERDTRTPVSGFLRSVRREQTITDEELRLDLERRGLERIVMPPASTLSEGRARMAAKVQESLKEVEAQRRKEVEEQKRKDKEEKELEDTGFGRKVELD